MRRCRGLFKPSGAFSRHRFSADYIITMFGFDFRQGQGAAFMSGTKNDLFVIEDIDTIANGLNRDTKKDKDGSNPFEERAMFGSPLHEILNSMDGCPSSEYLRQK